MNKKSDSPLLLLSIISDIDIKKTWAMATQNWGDFFKIEVDSVGSIENSTIQNKKYDIVFIDHSLLSTLDSKIYTKLSKLNSKFKLIVLKKSFEDGDHRILKQMVDDIIYFNLGEKFVKWKTIAELRRFWSTHSKGDLIIYGNLIMDFVKAKVWVNGEEMKLTQKENALLRYFYEHKGVWLDRMKIFEDVWEYKTVRYDFTRTIDQMVFKLKKKIGIDYFQTKRLGGLKFE